MSHSDSGSTDGRYSEICGATNNRGEPCSLPTGWGTAGSGGKRCKFHGGASTGPSDTEYLNENDFAEGNAGGGAPELNTNAETHGSFADWEKAYERFDSETRAWVDRLIADERETAKEHAPEVSEDRRERLLKEKATLSVLYERANRDIFKRGVEVPKSGDATGERVNPTFARGAAISARERKIAEELRLWWGFQD